MWVLLALLLQCVESGFVSAASTTEEVGYCSSEISNVESTMTCRNVQDTEQLRRDLRALSIPGPFGLTIVRSNMKVLPGFLFDNLTLESLRIIDCAVESMDEDSLVGVGSLDLLDLSRNRLTTVPVALRKLKSLQMLYIASNRITTLGVELASVAPTLRKLNLYGNNMSSVHADALKGMNSLLRLSLKNNMIQRIPPKLFRDAPRLQDIDLRLNILEDVDNLFDGLLELHTLKLDTNNIRHIGILSASNLPSLQSLILDYNPIDTFTLFDSRNAAVENLSLQHCKISDVASIPFSCIDRLRFLKVSHNLIKHIDEKSFPKSVNTTEYNSFKTSRLYESKCDPGRTAGILLAIDISHNYIDAINRAFHGIQLLEDLKIAHNELENVPDDAFKTNSNLKQLDMRNNKISWLGERAFRGLVSVDVLYLSSNRLTSLNRSLVFMPRLKFLYLKYNQLLVLGEKEFESLPRLTRLYVDGNNISDVRGAFRNLIALRHLFLHGNDLVTVHRASFPEDLRRLQEVALGENPLMCDCQLSWLYEIGHQDYDTPLCHAPPQLAGTSLFSNDTRGNLGVWRDDCDKNCTCICVVSGYKRFIKADCSNRGLMETPRRFPSDTSIVDLSGNLLHSLEVSLAECAPGVENLSLANNYYTDLDWKLLPTSLRYLVLQNNSLKVFPLELVSNLNLSGIWLSGNPWHCGCEDYAFRQWVESHGDTIMDAADVRCSQGSNGRVSSVLFMNLQQKDLCPFKTSLFVVYGVPLLVVLSLSLALTMIYLKRERQVKIWLYAHGLGCVKEDDLDKDKVFDVFLSFSSKDSEWAYSQLLPGLEESGFSVCTYDRNFKGGFLLQDIIQEAVACSRRTLLLLTQNFVESEWCRWEFRVAHHTALQDKVNRLIVVVVGEIPDDIDEELALYTRTTNYVRWGEKNFWNKLRYSLPKKDTNDSAAANSTGGIPLTTIYRNGVQ